MTVYIDKDYHCHAEYKNGFRAITTEFFNGKCNAIIECYRFIPSGETINEDGKKYVGEMVAPFKDISSAVLAQDQYEKDLAELSALIEEIYESDMERINE